MSRARLAFVEEAEQLIDGLAASRGCPPSERRGDRSRRCVVGGERRSSRGLRTYADWTVRTRLAKCPCGTCRFDHTFSSAVCRVRVGTTAACSSRCISDDGATRSRVCVPQLTAHRFSCWWLGGRCGLGRVGTAARRRPRDLLSPTTRRRRRGGLDEEPALMTLERAQIVQMRVPRRHRRSGDDATVSLWASRSSYTSSRAA